jgi:very-short-patch-repair endonuclease
MSALEETAVLHLRMQRLDAGMEREHAFAKPRRWRFDFAWPTHKVALEIEGGVWSGGRHTRGSGFTKDVEKYNRAAVLGWSVIRATGAHVKSGEAAGWVKDALDARAATSVSPDAEKRAVEPVDALEAA